MTTILPTDADNHVIPAVRLKQDGAHTIASTAASARNTAAFHQDTRIISLFATEDVYIRFGDDNVTATGSDHYFPKNIYYDIAIGGGKVPHYTHIAVLQVNTGGMVYISEKE